MVRQHYAESLVGRRLLLQPAGASEATISWTVLRYSSATNCLYVQSEGGVSEYLGWKDVREALEASLLRVVGEPIDESKVDTLPQPRP